MGDHPLSLLGEHTKSWTLETFRAPQVEVTTERFPVRELDGDPLPPGTTLVVSMWPSALTVCVPRVAKESG